MSAPAPAPRVWKFPKLTVEITQREDMPNYVARVVQGNVRGENLLAGEFPPVRRIENARGRVEAILEPLAEKVEIIDVDAEWRAAEARGDEP